MCEDKSVSVRPSAHPLRSLHPPREFDAEHIPKFGALQTLAILVRNYRDILREPRPRSASA